MDFLVLCGVQGLRFEAVGLQEFKFQRNCLKAQEMHLASILLRNSHEVTHSRDV